MEVASRVELRTEIDSLQRMYAEVFERLRTAIDAVEQSPEDINAVTQLSSVRSQLDQISTMITNLTTRLREMPMPGSRKHRNKSKNTRRISRTRKSRK